MVKNKLRKLSVTNKMIVKSGFWILFGTVISKVSLLVASIVIVKFVEKDIYGEFGMVKSTINMFTVFAGMGLGLTATKYIAQYRLVDKKKVSRIIGLSNFVSILFCIIVSAFFVVFAPELAVSINNPALESSLKLGAGILFFSGMNGIQTGILGGFERFKIIALNAIIASLFSSILQVIGAMYWGLNGIIVGFGLNFVLLYFLNFYSIRVLTRSQFNFSFLNSENFRELPVIWRFSIPAVLSGLMVSPVIWITNKFLVASPQGYAHMADFDIANQWRATILFLPGALAQIALPMFASADSRASFNKLFYKNILLNLCVSIVVVVAVIICLPVIVEMYGDAYVSAKIPLIVMLITTILVAVNNIVGNAIAGLDKMWLGFVTNLLWAVVLIAASYYLVKFENYGAIGLSFAYLISYVSHTVVQLVLYRLILKK